MYELTGKLALKAFQPSAATYEAKSDGEKSSSSLSMKIFKYQLIRQHHSVAKLIAASTVPARRTSTKKLKGSLYWAQKERAKPFFASVAMVFSLVHAPSPLMRTKK